MSHELLPVFISYASYDNRSNDPEERWLDRLLQFLKPLELDTKISSWADTELTVGANWKAEIRSAIEKAKVAILLVSPAFLASEFIRTEELPRLLRNANPDNVPGNVDDDMAEGMLVLPILLRPCLLDQAKFEILDGPSESRYAFLSDFQYVPKGSAMNGLSQYNQDKQLESVARRILNALEINRGPLPTPPGGKESEELRNTLIQFLKSYDRWWFNALRIYNWGSKQQGFQSIADYSVSQITAELEELARDQKILDKDGKKSRVYKAK